MAITIGICDDNPEQVRLLLHFLKEAQIGEHVLVQSANPNDFYMKAKECRPDLVFLDIDMPGINGIHLLEQIKAMYNDVVCVFITAHEQYALEAFRLRAFHYLLKPVTQETFARVLCEAIVRIKRDNGSKPDKVFTFQAKGEIIRLMYGEIRYFEKLGHQVAVHTTNRGFSYYGNFADLLRVVEEEAFVQCHQGYIANAEKIKGFRDKTLFLEGNIELPVSRSYADRVRETLKRKLFGEGGML